MTVPGNIDALLLGGQRGYQIERSLRFNSADSANLNRSISPGTNAKIGTFSFWCKRSKLGSGSQTILQQDANTIYLGFDNNGSGADTFGVFLGGNSPAQARVTTQVFRDPSSWYHFIVAVDTTHGTASERLKVYVNGTQITAFSTSNTVSQNVDVFASGSYRIGSYAGSIEFFSGYLTEIHFIDGQALTPSSFGETDLITGVWKPKKYAGTYGTNGFYLNFKDNSSTSALGTDYSGNSNTWTTNNFSITAGAGNDSMIDTPTPYADGGNGRGNYCTLNPLRTALTPTNGNLTITGNNSWRGTAATMQIPASGLYYFEVSTSTANQRIIGGLVTASISMSGGSWQSTTGFIGVAADSLNWNVMNNISAGNTLLYSLGGTGASEVIGIAINATTGNMWFSRNNVWYNSTGSATGDPAAGTNPTWTGLTASNYFPAAQCYDNAVDVHINFGQRAFAYTPPSGFLALNTNSLPEPSIKKPSSYFDTKLYTGNNGTLTVTGLGFSPDLVWIKNREVAGTGHAIQDTVRGATAYLFSNSTSAENTNTSNNWFRAFTSDGFTVAATTTGGSATSEWNNNGSGYVAWCWDESATPGFDIVTYTGDGVAGRTVSHSLGVAPSMIIVKSRNNAVGWPVYHASFGNTGAGFLHSTLAWDYPTAAYWNNTSPTSSVFSLGTTNLVNANTYNYVAYLWSEVAGFSKFGSYTGNGSSDGPFVFCGFRPRWIMVKRSSASENWAITDSSRTPTNVANGFLRPDESAAETSDGTSSMDILSNGFKLRGTDTKSNASGSTYVFAAFSESPFKYALAR
jgi:hypothetical protein